MITYQRITAACDGKPYDAVFRGQDAIAVVKAVNQGIDSRLEACFLKERDVYGAWPCVVAILDGKDVCRIERMEAKLVCKISPESLPVLLRRLNATRREEAEFLVYDILQTLGIKDVDIPFDIVNEGWPCLGRS